MTDKTSKFICTANASANLGNVYYHTGQMKKAEEFLQQALKIYKEIGDRLGFAQVLNNLGVIYQNTGQMEQARNCYIHARKIFVEIGAKHLVELIDRSLTFLGGK